MSTRKSHLQWTSCLTMWHQYLKHWYPTSQVGIRRGSQRCEVTIWGLLVFSRIILSILLVSCKVIQYWRVLHLVNLGNLLKFTRLHVKYVLKIVTLRCICCVSFADVGYTCSLLGLLHLYLLSVIISAPSLFEVKVCRNFSPIVVKPDWWMAVLLWIQCTSVNPVTNTGCSIHQESRICTPLHLLLKGVGGLLHPHRGGFHPCKN